MRKSVSNQYNCILKGFAVGISKFPYVILNFKWQNLQIFGTKDELVDWLRRKIKREGEENEGRKRRMGKKRKENGEEKY